MIVGAVTGPLYDAGYFYYLIATGSFLVVFGLMMTSLCTEYWQVLLAQAVCIGLGCGCIFVPSVAILPQYFTTRKAFVTGIAAGGSSLGESRSSVPMGQKPGVTSVAFSLVLIIPGGIIYPIVFYKLEPRIGFAWATRVIGFMALATLSLSLSLMRIRVLPNRGALSWN